jgi:hypothetical protein
MITKLGTRAKAPNPSSGLGTEINNARRCPILVRAAMITRCPAAPPNGNIPNYRYVDPGTNRVSCPVAASVQVHIRTEQVFRITGQPVMQTVDTVLDQKSVGTLNVTDVIKRKNAMQCLPGMTMTPTGCTY